ncbi:MAG: LacI family transcriptional regulator [Treponema sp.]|jgi:LacI family transcriptional regulator|nr:LacI family transcriptional regulator [Treponema sp.]
MISIKDIAKQVGTSPSTVSRVVNGKQHVNSEKRQRILSLIKETGYMPDKAARSMVLRRSFTVGLVIADTFNMFQQQLFSIIERYLEALGYHTLFLFAKFDEAGEEACLARIKKEKLDGLILFHEVHHLGFYEHFIKAALPVVAATCNYRDFPALRVDDQQAAFEAVCHLISLGHRKIGMINGRGHPFGSHRLEGYYRAMDALKSSREECQVAAVPHYTAEYGMEGMRELLSRGMDFTALFASTDELAIGAIRVLRDEGLRVPEDISVIGFDDINMSNYIIPRLTTIHQPLEEIGEQTALTLHRRIIDRVSATPEQIFPHRLIIRESTAPR